MKVFFLQQEANVFKILGTDPDLIEYINDFLQT